MSSPTELVAIELTDDERDFVGQTLKISNHHRATLLFPDGGRTRTAEEIEELEQWGERVRREQEGRTYPPGM